MKVTKVECPNCHGSLNIPDGMKEGFVSCEFCNTKVYIEPHKPDITQNFNIGSVNYNKANSVSDTDSLIDLKTWCPYHYRSPSFKWKVKRQTRGNQYSKL